MLHLVGCLYYLYQWCTVNQISNNEIYLLIKYIKSVLWRVAKRLSYIEEARCVKVKHIQNLQFIEIMFKNSISIAGKTVAVRNSNWLMLFGEVIAVCYGNDMKYINALCVCKMESSWVLDGVINSWLLKYCVESSLNIVWVIKSRRVYVDNCPTRCDYMQFIFCCDLLYMFQAVTPPIIRRTYDCIYSIWYWL